MFHIRKNSLSKTLFFLIFCFSYNLKSVDEHISKGSTISKDTSSENISYSGDLEVTRGKSCDNCSCSSNECSCDFFCSNDAVCKTGCVSSRTYFKPRLLTPYNALQLSLGNHFFYHHTQCPEDRAFFQVQASYFHFQSTKDGELAAYFTPNARRCVTITENGTGDVGSLWLGLRCADGSSFNSTICLSPRRKIDGGYFDFYFDFNSWFCGSWLDIAFAAFRAEHCSGLRECEITCPGTVMNITNAIQALNNPNWSAGRICPRKLTRAGVDDVQFRLGWNYYFCNFDHLGIYFVATAPTGCRTSNEYIFEPLVGSRHGSVGVGFNGDYTIWDCEWQALHLEADLKYRYVLSHNERRLFDLCGNGSWSRYLLVVTPQNPSAPMPGVNFFAQNVDITPGSTVNFWAALHYNWCQYNLEFGYDLFWRDHEKICFPCQKDLGVGIYDINGDCLGNPVSASTALICQTVAGANPDKVAASDPSFVNLTTCSFNLQSGAAPSTLIHTVYGAISYNSEIWCLPAMIGLVAAGEFARCNTALHEWWISLKTGLSF